ncbi:MAG: hypothetical protein JO130_02530 [Solirubrobacterales bacterium]|nr:hypothetical protein [Solirubrobacterales bacterium]
MLLGLLTWALPSLLLLVWFAPSRLREARRLAQARDAVRSADPARRRLLALRAALILPDEVLFRHSSDPAGDLLRGRFEPLAAAQLEALGLKGDGTVP